jgi:hypothetical protein
MPAKQTTTRKVTLNKKTASRRKAPAKTSGKARTVKKKDKNGNKIEVKAHEYSAALSREFETGLREAESVKAFRKTMKESPEFKAAHKEHCKRKRYEVKNGRTWVDNVEDAAIGVLIALGAYGGTIVVRDQVRKRRAEKALEVE